VMRWMRIAVVLLAAAVVAGCGAGPSSSRQTSRQQPTIRGTSFPQQLEPASQVSVYEDDYHGWPALFMKNGLVTVVAVPAIGGRIMEYKLGSHPFLWVNDAEFGKTYDPPQTEEERQWHNYGGYKVWPAPQSHWGGPPDPPGSRLDAGEWTSEITAQGGQIGEIELVSPPADNVTGLQIKRRVQMFAGTTKVVVTENVQNVSDEVITWSIWGITQVPGSLSSSEKFSEEARIYFPLNPDSRAPEGFWYLLKGTSDQFELLDTGKLMQVSYGFETSKIGADVAGGWMAYVDDINQYAFVQHFEAQSLAEYPDQGANVEIYTSGEEFAYMEMGTLSQLYTLQPGETKSYSQQWYATSLSGPVRDTTELAAIREPLQLADTAEGLQLTGELGIFAPGTLEINLTDNAGRTVGEPVATVIVSPAETVVLDQIVTAQPEASALALRLVNDHGTLLGEVASVPLATQTAQVP